MPLIKYSYVHLSSEVKLSIPIVNHVTVEYFISTSHGTLVCPLRTDVEPWGPLGGPSVPENGKLSRQKQQPSSNILPTKGRNF